MKNIKYFLIAAMVIGAFSSCKKWLDVNVDPDNPNSESVLIQNRLPWIQHFYMYSSGVSNFRTAAQAGVLYSNSGSGNSLSTTWVATSGNITPYQTFFVEVASNLNDLYNKAKSQNAYHYMAAADVFHALGFMQMLDIYGEMPYTQALSGIPDPTYDNGKTIFNGSIDKLNEAIRLFGQAQDPNAPSLGQGDFWNNGDVNKWIKLCYGLKARYFMKLSKKSDLYNADSILYFLSKGPQSNDDNTVGPSLNNSTATDYLLGDPITTNGIWDYAAYGSNQRISQYYYNLLTNMRGSNVVDPRMPKIVPASMSNVKLDASGAVISNTWNRSKGVDSYGAATRLLAGGPTSIQLPAFAASNVTMKYVITDATAKANFIAQQDNVSRGYVVSGDTVKITYPQGSIYINNSNYLYAGDTIYVNMRSNSIATGITGKNSGTDINWYPNQAAANAGVVGSTGSFQIRPNSDQEILTYHEMCFIKAEVYFRKGDMGNAYQSYLDGIKAHFNWMQSHLNGYQAAGFNNPDMMPMNQADINAYLASPAVVQSAGNLKMSDIMLQKYVAMGVSIENWNDMRRLDFSAGDIGSYGIVYPGFDRGPLFAGTSLYIGTSKSDPRYWPRRWMLPTTLELNYNQTNALAINKHASDPTVWSMPVWWDCATDDQYFGYLQ